MRSSSWEVWLTALAPALFIGLAGASRPALAEHTFEVLKSFELPDGGPSLVIGADGVLYGTTARGGVVNQGSFFRIDADGSFSVLYKFDGTEGNVRSGLVRGSDGAFYGTTVGGGRFGQGTIFRLDRAGVLTTLHSFDWSDGAIPNTGYPWSTTSLLLGNDGALYGTTQLGGSFGWGTVFRIDRGGSFRSLHSFNGFGRQWLTLGSDGAIYGVNRSEITQTFPSTVFRIDGAATFTSLHSYSTDYNFADGALIVANECSLYGTAGGLGGFPGIVYRLFEARPCQSIDFDPPADHFFGEPPFSVGATATSGLPVSLRASGPCTVTGDSVTLTGVGRCTLTASQGGDAPAPEVTRSFDVRSAACFDGLDNDSDGSTDFGADPDCSSEVDTNENAAPIALCRDVTVAAAAGTCGASVSVDGGSSDADGHALGLAQSPAGPYALGTTPVTLQVTESFGGASSCQALVTVSEETPPAIDCGAAALPRGKGAALRLSWSATDACSLATATTSAPQCFVAKKNGRRVGQPCSLLASGDLSFRKRPKKNTHVAWTVTARDAAGNESTKQCETVIGSRRP